MSDRVYEGILDMFSDEENPTPMVRLQRVHTLQHTKVYAKLEWYNPFGAIKDRVAANLLRDGEARGLVKAEQRLVEPTSGNTGMGLAMLANLKGYELTTPLSTEIPAEKRVMLKFAGAKVEELEDTLCPAPGAPEGAIARAMDLAERPDFHMLNQYQNEANFEAHMRTTGPEIWRQTQGRITHFVSAMGTCGTLTGNGRFLKGKNPSVQVIGAHPNEGHDIPGVRSLRQLQQTQLFRPEEYDELIEIHNDEAYAMCLRLNREEGIIAGPSAALGLLGALARVEDKPGNVVVVIFADNIYKYASSFERHFPEFRVAGSPSQAVEPPPSARYFEQMIQHSKGEHATLELEALRERLEAGETPCIVDVRPPEVFARGHLPGAINVPLSAMERVDERLPADKRQPIVTVCNRGVMSLSGRLLLRSMGYDRVESLNGGTLGWQELGWATNSVDSSGAGS